MHREKTGDGLVEGARGAHSWRSTSDARRTSHALELAAHSGRRQGIIEIKSPHDLTQNRSVNCLFRHSPTAHTRHRHPPPTHSTAHESKG